MKIKLFLLFCIITLNFKLGTLNCFSQSSRIWATYYGGSESEGTQALESSIATDSQGNIYVAGITASISGIASGGFQNVHGGGINDAFLVKFNSSGERLWASYYGGSAEESGWVVATDISGNVYLAGQTGSADGIASGGFQNIKSGAEDTYLVKFDGSGNRLWATYYGGMDQDFAGGLATDNSGNVFLAGFTTSNTGISSGGFKNTIDGSGEYDAFLVKFDSSGNRIWATYYGDTGEEIGYSVATDISGNVYLAGWTGSAAGIASGGFQNANAGGADAYLIKFDGSGNCLWATYYGGIQTDYGCSIATDALKNVYLAGWTQSNSNIASGGFQNIHGGGFDAYLVKFNESGSRLWGTYYGGTATDEGWSVATDATGNVYLAGDTYSTNDIAFGGFQNSLEGIVLGGAENEFVVKFDSDGNRFCSSYYGQSHDETGHVAVDVSGNIYLGGITTSTINIASGGFQNSFSGGQFDSYLVKFCSCCNSSPTADIISTDISCNGQCNGIATATVSTGTNSPYTYSWSNGKTTQTITGLCEGNYTVTVTDVSSASTTAVVTITAPSALSGSIIPTNILCNGENNGSATISSGGGASPYTYVWSNSKTNITITGLSAGTYTVTITDANSCTLKQTVIVTEPAAITASLTATPDTCRNNVGAANAIATGGTPPFSYQWNNGFTTSQISHLTPQIYSLTVTDGNGCSVSTSINISSFSGSIISISTDVTITRGDSFALSVSGGVSYNWSPSTGLSCTACQNPIARPDTTTKYYVTAVDASGCINIDSVTVFVINDSLFIPNVFTPNNDGKNDVFQILANGYKHYQLQIFNRWGEKIFESNSSAIHWDGRIMENSKEAADGTYYYVLTLTDFKEKNTTHKGFVTLLR